MRKTARSVAAASQATSLQRSRTANGAEKNDSPGRRGVATALQRSRTANGAEKTNAAGVVTPPVIASTEPHRERCGKHPTVRCGVRLLSQLQRSRTANGAEKLVVGRGPLERGGFNGAAPRTVRKNSPPQSGADWPVTLQRSRTANGAEKRIREACIPRRNHRFNGAAPRTVRKSPRTTAATTWTCGASTEPHRERCGKFVIQACSHYGISLLQRSRTANGAENATIDRQQNRRHRASTEPHRERCGKMCSIAFLGPFCAASTEPHRERCGKELNAISCPVLRGLASTEPHRERCGKVFTSSLLVRAGTSLQRSRTANGAEK